jgi:hypothetical protein
MNINDSRTGNVGLADEEAVKQILLSTIFSLWDIVKTSPACGRPPPFGK